jgi:inorganic pyrophosphatase
VTARNRPAPASQGAGLLALPPFHSDGGVHVVIETPRGSPAKFKFKPELVVFMLSRMLTDGTVYPHDWGYIPGTLGPDGDPVDAFVLGAAGSFPGLVIRARPIGILQVEQSERGHKFRNDRLLFLPWEPTQRMPFRDVSELRKGEKEEIERFFLHAVEGTAKRLRFLGWRGPKAAEAEIRRGIRRHQDRRRKTAEPGSGRR